MSNTKEKPALDNACNKIEDNVTGQEDGLVRIGNPNLKTIDNDILYHLGLATHTHDLVKMFGDVKFVCMGGSQSRMEHFAHFIMSELGDKLPAGTEVQHLKEHSYRYPMYKVGPVLSISHGIGISSLQILLHEIIKLLYYAKVKNPVIFRIGTSGGIGVEPGSVVVTTGALNEMIEPIFEQIVVGKKIQRPAKFNEEFVREIHSLHEESDGYELVLGKTMSSYDFYEGQGRLDGAFCNHTEADKMNYLQRLYDAGARNIEMEATCFSAMTHLAGIKSAILCVTFLNRFLGDQVCPPKEILTRWELRPQRIVARYIKRHL